jgi:PAS domain S-box-containing protein
MASGITTWDSRLEEMHGLAPGGFGGTFADWVAVLHPDDRETCLATVNEALASPRPYILQHRTTWPDGSVHMIECRGTVLVDDDGQPTGTTGVAIDVTLRERLVTTLQEALLPRRLPFVPGTAVAARYRPAETATEMGGDWYAVVARSDGSLGVAIGDVAGHGLDAVADMAAARFSLRALALTERRPEVVLGRLNQVVQVFATDTMITALYGIVDPRDNTWTYASAGHVPAVLRRSDGTTRLLDAYGDPPLGFAEGFSARREVLQPGDTLLLYTDGLVERRAEGIDLDRLRRACEQAPAEPESLCDHVLEALLGDNANVDDDVAVVAVNLRHSGGAA